METMETSPETGQVSCSSISRLGDCEVCSVKPAKYTCPRCELKTCCLQCSTIHKEELNCDGCRDKTKYIPLNKFTNLDLSSDIQLLEEMTRKVERLRKDIIYKFPRRKMLPFILQRLYKQAAKRKIALKFLPVGFKRRKKNMTRFQPKSNILFWHVEWVFVNAENLTINDTLLPENIKLATLIGKYFKPQNDPALQEKLQFYQSVGISGVSLLLKAEERKKKQFYELDPFATLEENLRNKLIIEYPSIYVVLKDHTSCCDIIDSDSEGDAITSDGNKVIEQIIKQGEREEKLYNQLKNLLFISESGEEEM